MRRRELKPLIAAAGAGLAVFVGLLVQMDLTMSVLLAALVGLRIFFAGDPRAIKAISVGLVVWAILLPLFHVEAGGFIDDAVLALAYSVMALGLNIIVGFAGLLGEETREAG